MVLKLTNPALLLRKLCCGAVLFKGDGACAFRRIQPSIPIESSRGFR